MLRSVLSRFVLICCLSSSHAIPALAPSSDTMPEALRRLLEPSYATTAKFSRFAPRRHSRNGWRGLCSGSP